MHLKRVLQNAKPNQPNNEKVYYNKYLKFGIIAALVALSVYCFATGSWGNGILCLLLIAPVVGLLYLNERILLGFWYLRKQNFTGAANALNGIKFPEKLGKGQQAYYHYLNGLLASQNRSNISLCEMHLKKALALGLRLTQDQAVAKLNLAGIAGSKGNRVEAQNLLREAKQLDTNKILSDQIKMFEDQMKQTANVPKYMMQGGGKQTPRKGFRS